MWRRKRGFRRLISATRISMGCSLRQQTAASSLQCHRTIRRGAGRSDLEIMAGRRAAQLTSPQYPRSPDNRLATDLVSAIRGPDQKTIGFIGVSVLVDASADGFPRSILPTKRSARLSIRTASRFSAMISRRIRTPFRTPQRRSLTTFAPTRAATLSSEENSIRPRRLNQPAGSRLSSSHAQSPTGRSGICLKE